MLRYTIFLFLFTSVFFFSCQENNQDSFLVKGSLQNVENGYFLSVLEKGDSIRIDTIRVDDRGSFEFRGVVDTLTVMSMYFNRNMKNTYIIVQKGWDIEMRGDVNFPDLIEVKGGTVNNDLTDFKNKNKDLLRQRTVLLDRIDVNNRALMDSDSVSLDKDYGVELKNLNFDLSNIAAEYVRMNPTKMASVILINTFFKNETTISRLDDNLNLLRGDAESCAMTQSLRLYSNKIKKSAVGSSAPYFSLKDLKGNSMNISQFRGKYLLLSFVSTTCEACNQERKDAVEVYQKLKKQKENIEFVTVVIDTETEPIGKTVKDSVKWILLPDYGSWAAPSFEIYNIHEIPYNILISPTGTILERDVLIQEVPKRLAEEKVLVSK